jgi:hypothetical protein
MAQRRFKPHMRLALLKSLISLINRLFVWTYGTKYNPLQRSGALTVALLTAVMVSGVYLLFFYSVAEPYASMQTIQNQWYLGRWIRAFHRYTSDAAVLVVIYHSIAMLVQGRSWGRQTLAWLSGVGMMCALFVSGWTGFVMVWDAHGQEIAQEGARLLGLFPVIREDLTASFSGEKPIPGSFFFMNLFLHIAIPLGMVFGLWIHTLKMGNIQIFPRKSIFFLTVVSIILVSILLPAPLLREGDLSSVIHTIPYDIWFSFFLPLSKGMSPMASVLCISIGLAVMLTAIFWSVPKNRKKPASAPASSRLNQFQTSVFLRSTLLSLCILAVVVFGSQVVMNMSKNTSLVRVKIELSNLMRKNCHAPSNGELGGKLQHMRPQQICDEIYTQNYVTIILNKKIVLDQMFSDSSSGISKKRHYFDYPQEAGKVDINVTIVTKTNQGEVINTKELKEVIDLPEGKIRLVSGNNRQSI